MLKILQTRFQQYVNCELPDVQAGFRKGRGNRDQIANIRWIIKKTREFQKNIYFCFSDYDKAELDVFLELSCFFDDPTDVGNLISGSSAFSKSSLSLTSYWAELSHMPKLATGKVH